MTPYSPAEPLPFEVPHGHAAARPAEARGRPRDGVRMLLVAPDRIEHRVVRDLPEVLHPGDLVVVNTSATVPAAVEGVLAWQRVTVHASTQLDDGDWVVEVRRPDNAGPLTQPSDGVRDGAVLRLPGGLRLRLRSPYPDTGQRRLWRAVPLPATPTVPYLQQFGRPIRYGYLDGEWPLAAVQNVYADQPGSAEMPSAGRPLTERVLVRLIARGVPVTPVVLHTGVSSQEAGEPPQPERFTVPAVTARLVNETRRVGRRVVAVGTTVVRALETVADPRGRVHAGTGWTDLVLTAERPARAVTGLLTGLHEPGSSHLALLEAVAGSELVGAGYAAATAASADGGYLWHEFGDSMILLP